MTLWFDESISYLLARLPLAQLLLATGADTHPPLYFLLLHPVAYFHSDLLLRLPSLVFFVLSLVIFRFYTKNTSHLLLFTLSPLLLYFAFQVRMYSLVVLLSLCSTICLLTRRHVLFAIYYALGLYTHYYFLLLAPVYFFLTRSKLPILIPLLTTIPWLFFIFYLPHPQPQLTPIYLSLPASLATFVVGGTGQLSLRTFMFHPLVFFSLGYLALFFRPRTTWLWLLAPLVISPSPRANIIFAPYFYLTFRPPVVPTVLLLLILALFLPKPHFPLTSFTLPPIVYHTSVLTYYPSLYYFPHSEHHLLTPNPLSPVTIALISGNTSTLPTSDFFLLDIPAGAPGASLTQLYDQLNSDFRITSEVAFTPLTLTHYSKKVSP